VPRTLARAIARVEPVRAVGGPPLEVRGPPGASRPLARRAWYHYGVRASVLSIVFGLAAPISSCTLPFDPALLPRDAARADGASPGPDAGADAGPCGSTFCADCQRCEGDRCVEGTVGQACSTGRCARPLSGEGLTCCAGCISGELCAMGESDAACGSAGEDCAACDGTILRCVDAVCRVSRPAAEVSLDVFHSCAYATSGEARCWGQPTKGSLDGTMGGSDDVELDGAFRSITAFGGYSVGSCGVSLDGALSCWGSNREFQLGVGTAVGEGNQPRTNVGTGFATVDGGSFYACALAVSGEIYCWGNDANRLGLAGATTARPDMTIGGCARWRSVSLHHAHACAICETDGLVYCWGDNSRLAAGRADTAPIDAPRAVPDTLGFELVRAGRHATCGIRGGRVLCWGTAVSSDLVPGDPTFASHTPTEVFPGETGYTDVSAGGVEGGAPPCAEESSVTCAIRVGALFCWGSNCTGELAQGDRATRTARVRVNAGDADESDWARVFAGAGAVCAIKESGALYCWGDNRTRQIVSSRVSSSVPDYVLRPAFIPLD
jgi:hypothetical protein